MDKNAKRRGGIVVTFRTEYSSPLGTLLLTSDGVSLTGLWMDTQPRPSTELSKKDDLPVFRRTKEWLDAYFRGEKPSVSTLPLAPYGTTFQKQVWSILLQIPYGESRTYGDIAREIAARRGIRRMSAQAVGGAVGRNPISIIIPCHRCMGANGQLTGYAGGLGKKRWLLRHEGITFKEEFK